MLESLINRQLVIHLESNGLLDPSQSGFRAAHSTETALVEVVDNIRLALDKGQSSSILVLLDLSAAFDTISHSILEQRLWEIGVRGRALKWLKSYLTDRATAVHIGNVVSCSRPVRMGVPQGSILSPTLFNLYVTPLARVIMSYGFDVVSYADDTQILITLGPDPMDTKTRFINCMLHVDRWISTNHLQLNCNKTEVILFGKAHEHWSKDWWPPKLGSCPIPRPAVRNLGILIDDQLSMKNQVNQMIGTCFGIMRSLRKIFKWIPIEARKPLVQGLIISRIDYGNALSTPINEDLLSRLQVLQNTAARLVLNLPPRSPSAPTLKLLHWLPVRKRTRFQTLCLAHKIIR